MGFLSSLHGYCTHEISNVQIRHNLMFERVQLFCFDCRPHKYLEPIKEVGITKTVAGLENCTLAQKNKIIAGVPRIYFSKIFERVPSLPHLASISSRPGTHRHPFWINSLKAPAEFTLTQIYIKLITVSTYTGNVSR